MTEAYEITQHLLTMLALPVLVGVMTIVMIDRWAVRTFGEPE